MSKVILLGLILLVMGCAKDVSQKTTYGACTAKTVNGQKEIVCPDGTSFPVNDGATGPSGVDGSNGYSVGAITVNATLDQCIAGGTQISFYKDLNSNGEMDGDDEVTSQFLVCNGATGATGATGSQGNTGATGTTGTTGAAGSSSSVSVSEANNTQCSTGGLVITTVNDNVSASNIVCNGLTGAVGAAGPTGSQGPAGTDINNISMVQLCPNVTAYPNTFSEYAVCFNNSLYGVYSENGGFWAYLPPGAYSSDGINSSCNLTIGPNCAVNR